MPACSFCKKNYEAPRGLTIFAFDGRSIFFCSSKCQRNAKLGRDSKKVNWVRKKVKDNVTKDGEKKVVEKVEEKVKEIKEKAEKIEEKKEVVEKKEEVKKE